MSMKPPMKGASSGPLNTTNSKGEKGQSSLKAIVREVSGNDNLFRAWTHSLMAKTVTASPRWRLLNMSANTLRGRVRRLANCLKHRHVNPRAGKMGTPQIRTAPTTVSGLAPKNPAKNLQMKTVCESLATATATLKTPIPNADTVTGHFLP